MIFGYPERSTYHTTMVNRVKSHLKRFCTDAGKEHGFIPGRRIDAWGYDKTKKTIYFCEIKVDPNDLNKAITQIHSSAFNFHPKNPENKVIPVIAIPKKLALGLRKYKPLDWQSFKSLCKTSKIALWIIEQSNIVQIQGPKPKAPKAKVKKTTKTTTKKKTTNKLKARTKAVKSRKLSTRVKPRTKSKSSSKKNSSTAKTQKTKTKKSSTKRKPTKKR